MSTENLIELVKQNPVLYDKTLALYKDIGSRNKTWEDIAKRSGIPAKQCKTKWEKLRNCYSNALKRRSKTSEAGRTMPPWKYEQEMHFLKQHITIKDTSMTEETFYDYEELESTYSPSNVKLENTHDENYAVQLINLKDSQASKRTLPEMDENDLFFLSMSMQIKKLPKTDQGRIRFKLHKMIHEAQMKKEDSSSDET